MRSVYITENVKYLIMDDEPFGYINSHMPYSRRPPPPQERRIAGSKRVERYQNRQASKLEGSLAGQLLQSITAHPALSTRSFEELRVECYAQSLIAQGGPPASVDAVATPAAVIPPLFNAYHDETDDTLPNEITMTD